MPNTIAVPGNLKLARAGRRRMRTRAIAAVVVALGTLPATTAAREPLPHAGPPAADRYAGLLASVASIATMPSIDRRETSAITVSDVARPAPLAGDLAATFDALDGGDVERARRLREGLASGSLDRAIATWAIALSGKEGVPAAEIAAARDTLAAWPGQITLANNYERALVRELNGAQLPAAFGTREPRTVTAKLALARALAATDRSRAAALVGSVWRTEVLDRNEERRILSWAAPLLGTADHDVRVAMLVHKDRITAAERIASRASAGTDTLVRAAGAVVRRKNAAAALDAVPQRLRADPLYLFAKARHLRRADRQRAAAATLAPHAIGAAAAVDLRSWWEERRTLARQLLDQGDAALAYAVVRGHSATAGGVAIDAEFHAGWIALRFLDDAERARGHFAKLVTLGSRSLSLSRGHYWLGRAEEALGRPDAARGSFETAAGYRTTFYGQLAMERLGRSRLAIAYPSPTDADRATFTSNVFVRAIERLETIGQARRARTLYRHLGRELETPGQAALLTARAERKGQFQLGLQLGKVAAARGLDADALAFPTGAIPADAPLSDTGRALAYAIARQESAFDREAVSGAGARGLLQLMPATAKEVAGWMNLPYSKARLTSDPGYNAALGARFLSRLLDRFDGSYVLTAVAYNAGPTRARNWREIYGDPVGMSVDEVVDWIERIPFTETRNYVQRVLENYQVYRARLEGRPLRLADDLRLGRGS